MKRALLSYLKNWIISEDRKPMVIRGARQVGKTWLVRQLASDCNKKLIELNFEKNPAQASLFNSNDVNQILVNLSAVTKERIDPENSILFLDEIQAVPELFAKLRWFAEDLPQLPVMAAGSLLEFVLEQHSFSMPVGRITYSHLEPLSFEEFLLAYNETSLYEYLQSYQFNIEIPEVIHQQFIKIFKEYMLVGGMPAVVSSWIKERSLQRVSQIQHDLLSTYRDDFPKYKGRFDQDRLEEVMLAIPKMLGQKFVYSRVNATVQASTIKQVIELLSKARLCSRVVSSAANGVPLGAEVDERYFKAIFLDVGLCCALLGLELNQINSVAEVDMINNGGIAEQLVGQMLRTVSAPYIQPFLYYWRRDEAGSSAEVDYVIQHGTRVMPIEVKTGATGKLKSLHLFMQLKKYAAAVRVNSDFPSVTPVNVKNHSGEQANYQLFSIPFYLLGQIHRLLSE